MSNLRFTHESKGAYKCGPYKITRSFTALTSSTWWDLNFGDKLVRTFSTLKSAKGAAETHFVNLPETTTLTINALARALMNQPKGGVESCEMRRRALADIGILDERAHVFDSEVTHV